jgi:DNA topoisomerase IA
MADQIVITEKSSQAKDVRAAVGSRYGEILPAEGHLFDLLEPEDVVQRLRQANSRCGTRRRTGLSGAKLLRAQ